MFDQVKILIILVIFGLFGFFIAKKVYTSYVDERQFYYWRLSWLWVVSAASLASNYWLFTLIVFGYCLHSVRKLKDNTIILYIFLLPALPMLSNELPGFGGIRLIFEFNYPRILALAILLPLFFRYRNKIFPLRKIATDHYFLLLVIYLMIMTIIRGESITDILRSILYIGTDYLLPYFVVSRLIDDIEKVKLAFVAVVTSIAILASVNLIEHLRHWFVYQELYRALNVNLGHFSSYLLIRDGVLRSTSVFASPIVFGYIASIALGLFLGLKVKINSYYKILLLLLLTALLTPLSRGPWVGFFIFIIVFIWYAPKRNSNLLKLFIYGFGIFLILLMTPYSDKVINLIPFVGDTGSGNISYRQDLLRSGLLVIEKSVFFGDKDFRLAPELQHLVQGQGIIDIVNTYLQMAMQYGVIGLILFLLFFGQPLKEMVFRIKQRQFEENERYLAIALVAILTAILVVIATVSQVDYIPAYYILIVSLISALIRLLEERRVLGQIESKK